MDIIFNCPFCDQELAADPGDAGTEIECPSCSKTITIPNADSADVRTAPTAAPAPANTTGSGKVPTTPPAGGPFKTKELSVPQRATSESLIQKPSSKPLDVAAKDTGRKMRVKTIKHGDCVEVGKDKFDEIVTEFITKIGEDNFVSLTPVTYTHVDVASQKFIADFAVVIVYKG